MSFRFIFEDPHEKHLWVMRLSSLKMFIIIIIIIITTTTTTTTTPF